MSQRLSLRPVVDSAWNLAGLGIPLAVGLILLPTLYSGYGTERMGVLLLIWSMVGYFGLFDLGLGRATTQFVSGAIARKDFALARHIAFLGFRLTAILGAVAGAAIGTALILMKEGIVRQIPSLGEEATAIAVLLALTIPVTVATAAARGTLEAVGNFRTLNVIRGALGIWVFVAPALALITEPSLEHALVLTLLGRALGLLLLTRACLQWENTVPKNQALHSPPMRQFLALGGWLTVTNTLGPLMTQLDRYVIAGTISATAVARYGAGVEITSKLLIVSQAVLATFFPLFVRDAPTSSANLLQSVNRAFRLVVPATFAASLVLLIVGEPFMTWWLGEDIGRNIGPLLAVMLFGVVVNAQASIPYTALVALGRARLTATNHVLELPPYLLLLWFLVERWGILGAAVAWSARSFADSLVLNIQFYRSVSSHIATSVWKGLGTFVAALTLVSILYVAFSVR